MTQAFSCVGLSRASNRDQRICGVELSRARIHDPRICGVGLSRAKIHEPTTFRCGAVQG